MLARRTALFGLCTTEVNVSVCSYSGCVLYGKKRIGACFTKPSGV